MMLILAHFTACLWYIIGTNSDPSEDNWLKSIGVENKDWFTQYVDSKFRLNLFLVKFLLLVNCYYFNNRIWVNIKIFIFPVI